VAATNAGIYEDSLTTSGLHVADGVVHHPINLNSGGGNFYTKPNGVFYVDLNGSPHVVESTVAVTLINQMRVATQSGPLLVNHGEVNSTILPWTGTALRNGIGVCRDGLVRIAMSTTLVTMADFAKLFASSGCDDALYLDGQVSGLVLPDLSVIGIGAPVAAVLGVYRRGEVQGRPIAWSAFWRLIRPPMRMKNPALAGFLISSNVRCSDHFSSN
jgi:uncharacterized protein YigE (DUF2233 family)